MECPCAQPVQAYLSTHLRFYASALGKENFFIVGEVNQAPECCGSGWMNGSDTDCKRGGSQQVWRLKQETTKEGPTPVRGGLGSSNKSCIVCG